MSLLTKIKPVPQILKENSGKIILGTLADADFKIKSSEIKGDLAVKAIEYLKKSLSGINKQRSGL